MTRAIAHLVVALFVCGILAALAPPLSVALANDLGVGRLNPTIRRQLLQQKKAKDAEEAEASDEAYERWLGKLEQDPDPGPEGDSVDEFDEEYDDSFFDSLLEYD